MNPRKNHSRPFVRQSGFTLLEALVTIVVFALGLLALVGLQSRSLKVNQSSMARSVASQYVYAMLDEMRSNWVGARNNDYITNDVGGLVSASGVPNPGEDASPAKKMRYIWARQLSAALPSSKVWICRRTNAKIDDNGSAAVTGSGCGNSGNYFVVRVDFPLGVGVTTESESASAAGTRYSLQSFQAVAFIPQL
ncbi:MAG: type IV pilus modification protein PilV [Zoogloeaceae bacterium]|jgi:type IV pilus assembly protein PilV|nr:type IV pilus modification protein PilV [Zoogloeaceae bacterium]